MAAHLLVAQQPCKAGLFGDQLLLVIVFVQAPAQVQRAEQALLVDAAPQWRHVAFVLATRIVGQRRLQALQRMRPTARLR